MAIIVTYYVRNVTASVPNVQDQLSLNVKIAKALTFSKALNVKQSALMENTAIALTINASNVPYNANYAVLKKYAHHVFLITFYSTSNVFLLVLF